MLVQEEKLIRADRSKIFDYLNDVSNRTTYIPLLEEIILHEEGPIQLGSRYTEVATIGGRNLKTTYQVIELVKPLKIGVKTVKSVFPIQVELMLVEVEECTLLVIELDFTLKGIYKLGAPIVQGIVRQQARDILNNLKEILEA